MSVWAFIILFGVLAFAVGYAAHCGRIAQDATAANRVLYGRNAEKDRLIEMQGHRISSLVAENQDLREVWALNDELMRELSYWRMANVADTSEGVKGILAIKAIKEEAEAVQGRWAEIVEGSDIEEWRIGDELEPEP